MQSVSVKSSKIQGLGVFAEKSFKKGEKILEIDDSHIVEDVKNLTQEQSDNEADWLETEKLSSCNHRSDILIIPVNRTHMSKPLMESVPFLRCLTY